MKQKYLQHRLDVKTDSISGNTESIILEYYLIESDVSDYTELAGQRVFGIGITKKCGEVHQEEDEIRNFSCCMDQTRQVIEILAHHSVTPVSLRSVLDDMLGI